MVQSMVVFLNGDTDYAKKKGVFKGQGGYRIGRVEGDSFHGDRVRDFKSVRSETVLQNDSEASTS
jgi:hypothetical protein